jgi:hypothetical protein
MIYVFEKELSYSFRCQVEADSFEEAKEQLEDLEWEEDDGGEAMLVSSRCKVYEDEEAFEDFDEKEELEWEP